jgi:K+/H+ antiporter YhaU regulatory subunit KhtT
MAQQELMAAQAEKRDALNRLNHVNLIEQEKKQAEAGKMKAFFQKSGIYKKYVEEKQLEQEEDKVFVSTNEEINRMKSKMNELHQKYEKLQQLVHKQDQDAVTLQQLIKGQIPAPANVTAASQ